MSVLDASVGLLHHLSSEGGNEFCVFVIEMIPYKQLSKHAVSHFKFIMYFSNSTLIQNHLTPLFLPSTIHVPHTALNDTSKCRLLVQEVHKNQPKFDRLCTHHFNKLNQDDKDMDYIKHRIRIHQSYNKQDLATLLQN